MVIQYYLLASNLFVTIAILLATIYRIKIEKVLIEIQYKNAVSAEKIRALRSVLQNNRNEFLNMGNKEFIELLEEVCKNEN